MSITLLGMPLLPGVAEKSGALLALAFIRLPAGGGTGLLI